MLWALPIRVFVKKSEKTNDEIFRKYQKKVFPAVLAEKNVFRISGSVTF